MTLAFEDYTCADGEFLVSSFPYVPRGFTVSKYLSPLDIEVFCELGDELLGNVLDAVLESVDEECNAVLGLDLDMDPFFPGGVLTRARGSTVAIKEGVGRAYAPAGVVVSDAWLAAYVG